jgi:hypothetical protein
MVYILSVLPDGKLFDKTTPHILSKSFFKGMKILCKIMRLGAI